MSAMPRAPFEIRCVDDALSARLALRGELDMSSAPLLADALRNVARGRRKLIVLDLAELEFMDVAGLRTILDAARRARRDGGRMAIANPSPHIVRLLELTALDQTLELLGRPLAAAG